MTTKILREKMKSELASRGLTFSYRIIFSGQ